MPTYEYACTSCGRRVEVVQRFTDDPLESCEVCSGALKRIFHPVGIVLKGSGFYATDSREKKKKFMPATEGGSSGSSSSSDKSGTSGATSGTSSSSSSSSSESGSTKGSGSGEKGSAAPAKPKSPPPEKKA